MVLELNASNQVVQAYVNGPGMDQPIERIGFINGAPRNRQSFHADGLGSIAALTDESGDPVQIYTYAAFGGIRARSSNDLNRVTYTAREAIGDTLGFYYYRNRVLDPNTGRFTSEDPLGFVDGANRYWYVKNNPFARGDSLGLQCDEVMLPVDQIALKNELLGNDLVDEQEIMDGFNDAAVDLLFAIPGAAINPSSAVPGLSEGMEASDIMDDPLSEAIDKVQDMPLDKLKDWAKDCLKKACKFPEEGE